MWGDFEQRLVATRDEYRRVLTAMRQQGPLGELLAFLLMLVVQVSIAAGAIAGAVSFGVLFVFHLWWLSERLDINFLLVAAIEIIVVWGSVMAWLNIYLRRRAQREGETTDNVQA